MLHKLLVKNYAIIDEVTIRFTNGLNIITGETGAGKSILLGALSIVLGERANLSTLFDKSKKCIVEAEFFIKNLVLQEFFSEHELDYDDNLILRRELLPSGRSRAFINDTPVTLQILQSLTTQLINVHRQFATLDIFNRDFQTKIVDAIANQVEDVAAYKKSHTQWQALIRERDEIQQKIINAAKENDFIQFQLNEIREFNINPEEDDLLVDRLKQAEHFQELQRASQEILGLLKDDDVSADNILNQVTQTSHQLSKIHADFSKITDRIESVRIELNDIYDDIIQQQAALTFDPETLAEMATRHDQLQRLLFKHQLPSASELLQLFHSLEEKINDYGNNEEILAELSKKVEAKKAQLINAAKKISAKRKKHIPVLEKQIHTALAELALNNARFEAKQEVLEELDQYGIDLISFLFSANPGSTLLPIKQVASGGELSRLSLALKSIVAQQMALPTMVFDEIDSGVSGDTALRMGKMLRAFGHDHQTIVITHSPQVAAQGNAHYFVSKVSHKEATSTAIHELSMEEREEKIAIMLSSDPPTEAARVNAKELLQLQA